MRAVSERSGQGAVEWLVAAVIVVAVLGGIILEVNESMRAKLREYNDAL